MKYPFLGAISLALTVASCSPSYADTAVPVDPAPATCDTPQKVSEGLITSSATRGFTVALYDEVTDPALVAQFVQAFNDTPPRLQYRIRHGSGVRGEAHGVGERTAGTTGDLLPSRLPSPEGRLHDGSPGRGEDTGAAGVS